jgi:hypothetical protein
MKGRRALLASLVVAGCTPEPAVLEVRLDGTATAMPQFFHGNCFAGFSVSLGLRLSETRGVDVRLESFAYRIRDDGSGASIAEETLDAAALEERYGSGLLPGRSSRTLSVGGPASNPVGPLSVSGEVRGRDENGARVSQSFQLSTTLRVEEPVKPSGGAC